MLENVLSLFDGMSCGKLALEKAGIKHTGYLASEIDENAIKVSMRNFPDIVRLGDVTKIDPATLPPIDLLIGGSPCQSFSPAISSNTGFDGKSKLFFEYVRLLKECKPRWFLLENVEMRRDWRDVISSHVGVEPVAINSSKFSAQDRPRLYWTNIPIGELPDSKAVLGDVLEPEVDEKYFYKEPYTIVNKGPVEAMVHVNGHDFLKRVNSKKHKCQCLTTVCGGNQQKKVLDNGRARKLTPLEYERLQTVPEGYTAGVSNAARYRMLGNGWTVDVIAHILKGIPQEL